MSEPIQYPTYSLISEVAAQAAFLVYQEEDKIKKWPGAVLHQVDNHALFVAPFRLIGEGFTRYVIAFRGTDDKKDLFTNLGIIKSPYPAIEGAKVHGGYHKAYELLQAVIEPLWQEGEYPHLLMVGHSMGGGLATLAAADYALRGYHCDLINFGSPKVGNEPFCHWLTAKLEGRWLRYWMGDDAVPDQPWVPGYCHGGTELHLWEGGEFTENPSWWERNWRQVKMVRGFSDHSMEGYLSRLTAN